MGILTEDMKRVVTEQRLGFVATVCPDGTPNLSPKGTTAVWDDDHIVFADVRSPATVSNLRRNPSTEINVVDPMVRKGYRFKGVASVLTEGALFERILDFYRTERSLDESRIKIRSFVLVMISDSQFLPYGFELSRPAPNPCSANHFQIRFNVFLTSTVLLW